MILHLDAAAALGILERRGVGRVRHLDVASLWLQEKELRRIIEMHKVPGLENPADLATKHLTRDKIDKCCGLLGYSFVDGRSATTANLHSISCESLKWRFPTAVRSHGKEFGAGPDPVGKRPQVVSSGDDRGGEHRGGEARHWQCVPSTHWRGTFRGARSHRSPSCACISWGEVTRMTTSFAGESNHP